MTSIDAQYTQGDHLFRDIDPYALGKYRLTLRWLRALPLQTELANIGCGAGTFNELAVAEGYRVRAFEPDPAAFAVAQRRASRYCKIEPKSLFEIEQTLPFDVAVMHDVLEHIDAEARALDHVADLLAPDGRLIISVPALESLFGYHDVQLGHYRRYTRTSLKRALARRFDVEKIRYFGFAGIPLALWYSKVKGKGYPTTGADSDTLASRLASGVFRFESRVPAPVGTSVIALARRL